MSNDTEDLKQRGYVFAYNKARNSGMPKGELLHAAFPAFFVAVDDGNVYCHRPGEMLMRAVSRAVALVDAKMRVKGSREASVQREVIACIKTEFSEDAIRAVMEVSGGNNGATQIAERAIWRLDLMRTGKRPAGEIE